ncbi:HpcH/HpaI aldolase family protein [Variovorax terrae]|uniref:Aldolase/citrate lyase family protein n=1 Tax=Variovorax terrae TaxID=2923278 RepID=A0A9X2AM75_9BURK|nr:aldolase/citrate lyase family protein [Variovorax terrae]MCJ0763413.1 aldolase/citrate lyase family protein [Variovorax terrae]
MTQINRTKARLQEGGLALGMGLRQARTVDIATIAGTSGFDWLFIDMEHNSMSIDTACQIAMAAVATGVTPLVRVPGHQHYHCARALDNGALGVVVPHVDTAEEARAIVDACRYPPMGHRSIAGNMPGLGFASLPVGEATQRMNDETLVVVMLETPKAIENADEIAAVEGIDVLLVGTNDLCAEMGIHGDFANPRVPEAYRKVLAACARHGKHPGMGGVYDPKLMAEYIGLGMRFILSGNDLAFLMAGARERSSMLRAIAL